MKIAKKDLDFKKSLEREWIISNGIGGFASQSILGINTRKYHGLLVAPLDPPSRRYVVLSKLDESIVYRKTGEEKILYSNMCRNYISEGYKNLTSFEKVYNPIFTYKVDDIVIEKQICMVHGQNTVCITYNIKNSNEDILLKIAPVMNFRDFHQMNTNHEYKVNQKVHEDKIKLVFDDHSVHPVYLFASTGTYIEHENDTFRNIYYLGEEKRGFFPEENLVVPGRYEIEIKAGARKKFTVICSLEENIEEIDGFEVIKDEKERLDHIVKKSGLLKEDILLTKEEKEKNEILRDLVINSDLFITYRPKFGLYTIIAGYHWFLDWGRDTLISFEGLTLVPKRYELAREVLLMVTRDIKYGLIPNGYSGFDSRPLYNSVDSSLLLYEQIQKYVDYTGDTKFIKNNFYRIMKNIIKMFKKGIDIEESNIYVDEDGLVSAGTEETQLTWMDAKVGNIVATPRNGKAVEINALWYNALKITADFAQLFKDEATFEECETLAKKVKISFRNKFYDKEKKCLKDTVEDSRIRPNQLFALALKYPVINPATDTAKEIFNTVNEKLITKYGIATLAKGEKGYYGIYEGDSFKRDMIYHQGVTWPWITDIYLAAYRNKISAGKNQKERDALKENYDEYVSKMKKVYLNALYEDGAIGNLSELYDSRNPYNPGGCIAQAWSLAMLMRLMQE